MSLKPLRIAAVLVPCLGCASTLDAPIEPITRLTSPRFDPETRVKLAHVAVQTQYTQTGSDQALAWLLFNGVRSGMEQSRIEQTLGQPLEPTDPPADFTTAFGIQEQDEFYQIGPTQQGWYCLFHFRDGKLLKYHTLPPEPAD
jgi:hypothetical protein